jgi:hypothetical protein
VSGANGTAPKRAPERKLSELMREMGSKDGGWNPAPPDQDHAFLRSELVLTSNAARALAWIKWRTTNGSKPGGRTPFAADERGRLTLVHMAKDLGWSDLANASRHASELEEKGFARRDNAGVFWLNAEVVPCTVQTTIEDDSENASGENRLYCTYNLPKYISERFQQLTKDQQRLFLTGWSDSEEWGKAAQADAVAIIRERVSERQNRLCKELMGIELKSGKKRRDPEAPTAVQVMFPDSPVHTTSGNGSGLSAQSENGTVYSEKNNAAHTTASLFTSENREQRNTLGASSSSQQAENATTTTHSKHVPMKREQLAVPEPERTAEAVHEALMTACPGESVPRKHANELIERCRASDPKCTAEQIVGVIYQLRLKRKGTGSWFFVVAVPEHFPLEKKPAASEVSSAAHRTATADESIALAHATLNDPKATEQEKSLARVVLDESEPSAHVQKAGSP